MFKSIRPNVTRNRHIGKGPSAEGGAAGGLGPSYPGSILAIRSRLSFQRARIASLAPASGSLS